MSEQFSILECEQLAKESGAFDKARFELVGPFGRIGARWLDAYMGLLVIDGEEGFTTTKEIRSFGNIWCENFSASEVAA